MVEQVPFEVQESDIIEIRSSEDLPPPHDVEACGRCTYVANREAIVVSPELKAKATMVGPNLEDHAGFRRTIFMQLAMLFVALVSAIFLVSGVWKVIPVLFAVAVVWWMTIGVPASVQDAVGRDDPVSLESFIIPVGRFSLMHWSGCSMWYVFQCWECLRLSHDYPHGHRLYLVCQHADCGARISVTQSRFYAEAGLKPPPTFREQMAALWRLRREFKGRRVERKAS